MFSSLVLEALEVPFCVKLTKCPCSTLGWPKVKDGHNHPKTTVFMLLHQTRALWRFSSSL